MRVLSRQAREDEMEQLFLVKGYSDTQIILVPQRDNVEFDVVKLEAYLQTMDFARGEGTISILTEEEWPLYGCEERGGLLFRHNDDPNRRWKGLPDYITQDEEGNCDCPRFVVKMMENYLVVEQMKKLNAPFMEAFCSDYELFRNPQKAYDYAVEYANHYDSLDGGFPCNRPSSFEVFKDDTTGFELLWETRSGNRLTFCICASPQLNPDWEEGYDEEDRYYEKDLSWVEYQTSSSMMLEL